MAQAQQATKEERGLTVYEARDGSEIKLSFGTVRAYLVQGHPEYVTDQEIIFFMGTCKARGLNPFKKDCYLVKYTERENAAIITSIDYYRSRAKAQKDCQGWKSGIILLTPDRKLEFRPGSFILDDETLVGGWFKAKPAGWEDPYEWSVPLAPYVKKTREGNVTQFWTPEKQSGMISKVAESQGLRRVWPDEFQNLLLEEELLDNARDVTEAPKGQFQIPQSTDAPATNKQPPSPPDAHSDNDGRKEGPQEDARESRPPAQKDSAKNEKVEKALEWIAGLKKEDFPHPRELSPYIKGLKGSDQQLVCQAFNDRKAELDA